MDFKGSHYPGLFNTDFNIIVECWLDTDDEMVHYIVDLKGTGFTDLFEDAEEDKSIGDNECSLSVYSDDEIHILIDIKKNAHSLLCPKSKDETINVLAELLSTCDGFNEAKKLLAKKGKKIGKAITRVEWLAIDFNCNEYFYLPTKETLMDNINKMIKENGRRQVIEMLEDDPDVSFSNYGGLGPLMPDLDELESEQTTDDNELPTDLAIESLPEEEEEIRDSDEYEETIDLAQDGETGFDFEECVDTVAGAYCEEFKCFDNCAVYKEFVFDNGESYYYSRDDISPDDLL